MAKYPIKVLLDADRKPFIPFITSSAIPIDGSDKTIGDILFETYTKEEIDALFESLGTIQRLMGRVDTVGDLNNITNPKAGDVYIVGNAENNSEYIYTESGWEELGPYFTLEGYVKTVNGVAPDVAANVDLTAVINGLINTALAAEPQILSGTSEPIASDGKDGDIYIMIGE